jgi:hypothetical protein
MELTPAFVQRLVVRLFAENDRVAATDMLAQHALHANHPEVVRVQVAVLKLSEGNTDALRRYLRDAMVDYRDVLAWAEYPAQMNSPVTGLTPEQKGALLRTDAGQYDVWLKTHRGDET